MAQSKPDTITIEEFDDIFDIVDDDYDTLEYTNGELNQYFKSGHLNSIVNEDDNFNDDSNNDVEEVRLVLQIRNKIRLLLFFFIYLDNTRTSDSITKIQSTINER